MANDDKPMTNSEKEQLKAKIDKMLAKIKDLKNESTKGA
jgi:hypothetical protein